MLIIGCSSEFQRELSNEEKLSYDYLIGKCHNDSYSDIFSGIYPEMVEFDCEILSYMVDSDEERIKLKFYPSTNGARLLLDANFTNIKYNGAIKNGEIFTRSHSGTTLNNLTDFKNKIQFITPSKYSQNQIYRIELIKNTQLNISSGIGSLYIKEGEYFYNVNFRFLDDINKSRKIEILESLGAKKISCSNVLSSCGTEFDVRLLNGVLLPYEVESVSYGGFFPIWQISDLKNLTIEEMKYCEDDSDCIPVECSCKCSGGSGFTFDEIINKKYKKEWHLQRGCGVPGICPTVICSNTPKISCVNNQCLVE